MGLSIVETARYVWYLMKIVGVILLQSSEVFPEGPDGVVTKFLLKQRRSKYRALIGVITEQNSWRGKLVK